jgi:hypothetical protein
LVNSDAEYMGMWKFVQEGIKARYRQGDNHNAEFLNRMERFFALFCGTSLGLCMFAFKKARATISSASTKKYVYDRGGNKLANKLKKELRALSEKGVYDRLSNELKKELRALSNKDVYDRGDDRLTDMRKSGSTAVVDSLHLINMGALCAMSYLELIASVGVLDGHYDADEVQGSMDPYTFTTIAALQFPLIYDLPGYTSRGMTAVSLTIQMCSKLMYVLGRYTNDIPTLFVNNVDGSGPKVIRGVLGGIINFHHQMVGGVRDKWDGGGLTDGERAVLTNESRNQRLLELD